MLYRILQAMAQCMSCIPFSLGQSVGGLLGAAAFLAPSRRKELALENIRRSFEGRVNGEDPERILRKAFVQFGRMLFEAPHVLRLNRKNLSRYVVVEGFENLTAALRKGKGAFALTAHFGNWELMSAALSMSVESPAIVVRPIDFEPLEKLMHAMRSRFGAEIIYKQRAMRRLLMSARERKVVGILLDQNVDWYEGAFVNFLGRPACTNKGLALVVLRTGAPVLPVFSVRQHDGRYRIVFEKEVALIRTGDRTKDVEENTALFTSIIEKFVRRYPDHWFWFHRRWKTRPYCPLPAEFYES